jgi:hypothetical protein
MRLPADLEVPAHGQDSAPDPVLERHGRADSVDHGRDLAERRPRVKLHGRSARLRADAGGRPSTRRPRKAR